MKLAIKALKDGPLDPTEISRFIDTHSFPIVEGSNATFVYRGEAEEVRLQHWIYGLPSAQSFKRLDSTDLWHLTVDLPPESRVEYKIEVIDNGEGRWILDPLNPHRAHDPFGSNSVCHGHLYKRPDWTLADPAARQGRLKRHSLTSSAFGDERSFRVYIPARFRARRRYPLLVVHDGEDFLKYAQFKTVLDNLIQRLEIAPFIAVLSKPSDRLQEYGADPRHAQFLAKELLPFMESHYPIIQNPASRGLMGASFGAVASLHAAWRYPNTFGQLLLQSGSFAFSEIGPHKWGPVFDSVVDFINTFREDPGRPSERIFVSCGIYEPLIYENRSMIPLLQQTGMKIRYTESHDGHNWENWRDRLRDALSWLFPGPLWMVYE